MSCTLFPVRSVGIIDEVLRKDPWFPRLPNNVHLISVKNRCYRLLFALIRFTELRASLYCYSILDIHVSFIIYVHKRLFIACRLPSVLIWIISKPLWLYRAWSNCKADHQRCTLFYCWRAVLNQASRCNLFNAVQRVQCGEFHRQSIPSTFHKSKKKKKSPIARTDLMSIDLAVTRVRSIFNQGIFVIAILC